MGIGKVISTNPAAGTPLPKGSIGRRGRVERAAAHDHHHDGTHDDDHQGHHDHQHHQGRPSLLGGPGPETGSAAPRPAAGGPGGGRQ